MFKDCTHSNIKQDEIFKKKYFSCQKHWGKDSNKANIRNSIMIRYITACLTFSLMLHLNANYSNGFV